MSPAFCFYTFYALSNEKSDIFRKNLRDTEVTPAKSFLTQNQLFFALAVILNDVYHYLPWFLFLHLTIRVILCEYCKKDIRNK